MAKQLKELDVNSLSIVEAIALFQSLFVGNKEIKAARLELKIEKFELKKAKQLTKLVKRINKDVKKGRITHEQHTKFIELLFPQNEQ